MNGTELKQVEEECYLGMVLNTDLSWKPHTNKMICKASKKIGLLYKIRNKISRSALSKYYTTFIRPVLEYGSVVIANCTAYDAHRIEQVQRRAAILCTGAFRRSSYKALLSELGWESLEDRRRKAKLILMFKILNNLTPQYLKDQIPPQVQETTQYNLRNRTHVRIPLSRTSYCHLSYIPSTLKLWNALDPELRNSRTLNRFKRKLKFRPSPLVKLYSISYGHGSRSHTQIRLGLSKLRTHLFSHSIISEPYCTQCQLNANETPLHYFLCCPAFAAQRVEMLRGLRDSMTPEQFPNNRQLLQIIIHGNPDSTIETNRNIFKLIHQYILSTKRFTV